MNVDIRVSACVHHIFCINDGTIFFFCIASCVKRHWKLCQTLCTFWWLLQQYDSSIANVPAFINQPKCIIIWNLSSHCIYWKSHLLLNARFGKILPRYSLHLWQLSNHCLHITADVGLRRMIPKWPQPPTFPNSHNLEQHIPVTPSYSHPALFLSSFLKRGGGRGHIKCSRGVCGGVCGICSAETLLGWIFPLTPVSLFYWILV